MNSKYNKCFENLSKFCVEGHGTIGENIELSSVKCISKYPTTFRSKSYARNTYFYRPPKVTIVNGDEIQSGRLLE